MKKIILLTSGLFMLVVTNIKAQDFGQILAGSQADANKYLGAYLDPFGKGEIMNMGRGWFSSAKVHKTLGFDVTVSAQMAIVPNEKTSFVFNNADYSTFRLKSGASSATLPTFVGDKTSAAMTVSTTVGGKNVNYDFNTPTGLGDDIKKAIGTAAVPLPVAQVSIGLIKHTEVKLRYFPKTDYSGTEIGVFGAAIQHEFTNYLPFLGKVPLVHLSALVGYNSVNTSYSLGNKSSTSGNSTIGGANQKAELNMSALTVQAIGSVKLAMFEAYAALGYVSGKADANLKGSYTFTYKDNVNPLITYQNTVVDPVALSYTNSGLTSTVGLRLNLLFLKVFADYTMANYNGVGAGVSLSFR